MVDLPLNWPRGEGPVRKVRESRRDRRPSISGNQTPVLSSVRGGGPASWSHSRSAAAKGWNDPGFPPRLGLGTGSQHPPLRLFWMDDIGVASACVNSRTWSQGPIRHDLRGVPCEVHSRILETAGVFVSHMRAAVVVPEPEPACVSQPVDRNRKHPVRGDEFPLENLEAETGENGGLDPGHEGRVPGTSKKENGEGGTEGDLHFNAGSMGIRVVCNAQGSERGHGITRSREENGKEGEGREKPVEFLSPSHGRARPEKDDEAKDGTPCRLVVSAHGGFSVRVVLVIFLLSSIHLTRVGKKNANRCGFPHFHWVLPRGL